MNTYLIRYKIVDGLSEYYDDWYVRGDFKDVADYANEVLVEFWEDCEIIYEQDGTIDYVESDYRQARLETISEFEQMTVFNVTTNEQEKITMLPSDATLHNK